MCQFKNILLCSENDSPNSVCGKGTAQKVEVGGCHFAFVLSFIFLCFYFLIIQPVLMEHHSEPGSGAGPGVRAMNEPLPSEKLPSLREERGYLRWYCAEEN